MTSRRGYFLLAAVIVVLDQVTRHGDQIGRPGGLINMLKDA